VITTTELLDKEYNPRVQIPEFANYFLRWKTESQKARESLHAHLNVPYGVSAAESLDFFPASVRRAPLLIFIHGGYWRALDKADFSYVAPAYVAAGIAVAVLNYGLAPGTSISNIVGQIRRACRWAYNSWEIMDVDPRRIFCAGHSAGGHLTAMMMATNWPAIHHALPRRLLAGAFTVSGLFDLEPLTRAEFLRSDLALDATSARAISPCYLPLQNYAPLLRAVGALESREFHRQSELIAERWPVVCKSPLIDVLGCHHLSICDALAARGDVLFETMCAMILSTNE
jgi:arylformamidase